MDKTTKRPDRRPITRPKDRTVEELQQTQMPEVVRDLYLRGHRQFERQRQIPAELVIGYEDN